MNVIKALIKKAEENISASELLLSQGYYNLSIARIYYAMFYIAEALLLTKDLSYSSHKGVISAFGKEFVKTGIFDPKFHKMLIDAFKSRQDADYEPAIEFTKEETEKYIIMAKEFLKEAKKYLKIK